MSYQPPSSRKVGYTRKEFGAIFQVYSQNVYNGLFRDFSFTDMNDCYYISFREEAGAAPLVTIEKRRLGPDRVLFIATSPGAKGKLMEIARSEKIDSFVRQLQQKIDILRQGRSKNAGNVSSMI